MFIRYSGGPTFTSRASAIKEAGYRRVRVFVGGDIKIDIGDDSQADAEENLASALYLFH